VVPSFTFPEAAARALARVADYSEWRDRPVGEIPKLEDVDRAGARHLAASLLAAGEGWLDQSSVQSLLQKYGIRAVRTRVVRTPQQVGVAAAEIGRAVALKVDSRSLLHKTDVGGVRLDLNTPEAAQQAAMEMERALQDRGVGTEVSGYVVQEMAYRQGIEFFVGVTHDPLFGPLLACGSGGTLVELTRDLAVRITPVTDVDLDEMLRALKMWPLFEGYRGQPALDAAALRSLLFRVSAMVEDLPHIAELDLNPVLVSAAGEGCVVLDARVRLRTPRPDKPLGARTT
jgi:acyl-CoA synthetase (NDP forming)